MKRAERLRRFVDGELTSEEKVVLLGEAERDRALAVELYDVLRLEEELALLRDCDDLEPPAHIVNKTMARAVEAREQRRRDRLSWLRWLWEPRTVRFRMTSAAWLVPMAAGVLLWAWGYDYARDEGGMPSEPVAALVESTLADDASSDVAVRFVLQTEGASSVAVAGDFNEWSAQDATLADHDGDGVFVGTVSLPPGSHAYMFVVDGERWVSDPQATSYRDDGFGNRNAILRID